MPTPSPVPDTDAPTPGSVPSLVEGGGVPGPVGPPPEMPSLPGVVAGPPPELNPELPGQSTGGQPSPGAISSVEVTRAYISTSLSIPSGVTTDIPFDTLTTPGELVTEGFNLGIRVKKTGWYHIESRTSFYDTVIAGRVSTTVKITGVRDLLTSDMAATGGFPVVEASGMLFLPKGSIIGVSVYQNSGITRPLAPLDPALTGRVCSLTLTLHHLAPQPLTSKIIGVGDSTMEGAVSGVGNVAINFLSPHVVNFGLSSITTSALAGYVDDVIAAGGRNVDLVIAIGINDLLTATPDINAIAGRIQTFVAAVRPHVRRIVWSPLTPVTNDGYPGNYETSRAELIAKVISLNIPGLRIARTDLDPTIGLAGRSNVLELYPDKLHPSALGQYYISRVILPHLQ